ncbi:MAG: SH3 domain-containing protein [Caldilineaceae bacterium]|nr:SH3 domain-containing protein [Caldilineaceae bacterium]
MLVGCGPENGSASEQDENVMATQQIAVEFATTQNVSLAQAQLDALGVANVDQWLLYVTETNITSGQDPAVTDALVRLSNAIGLQSASINQYAIQHNILNAASTLLGEANPPATAQEQAGEGAIVATAPAIAAVPLDTASQPAADGDSEPQGEAVAAVDTPTSEPTVEVVVEEPTATPLASPALSANSPLNVRNGPGLAYLIVAAMQAGETADVTGKNDVGDWWQVTLTNGQTGWVFGQLVTTQGDVNSVALITDIPAPPTPEPVAVAPTPEPAPAEEAPAQEAPAAAPAPGGPDFRLVERRLWSVTENGGRMDGPSVICGEKRQLVVQVLDAAGNPLNGVAVQVVYGNKEIYVSGSQGKGDGVSEFVLGDGQDVKVVKDVDGREVSSDVATGLSTKPYAIAFPDLIAAGFCTDDASCQKNIVDVYACGGHYSWTVKFQRNY